MPEALDDPSLEATDWRKHWRMLCRRRWWLALPAFGIWLGVWSLAWFLPAAYRSETVILVEQQKVPETYVVPNVSADLQDQLQNLTQQILGRERLLDIMQEFNLYPALRARVTGDEMVERMRKDIQVELVQAANRSGNLSAFKVAYLSDNPALAQQVTDKLTSLFINENLKTREGQSKQTTQFLADQLEEAGRGLAEQEAKVKEFKSQYLGQLPEQVQSNVQILAGLQAQLQQETDLLGRAKQQNVYLDTLRTQWRTLEGSAGAGNSGGAAPPALDQELARLRAELDNLNSHYTDRHPDVRKVKEQIANAEKLKKQAESRIAAAAPASGTTDETRHASSPTEMEVESQLKANKVEIENRQRAIQNLQKGVGDYQARLNMTPVREQQMLELTRKYDQSRKNYEELQAKLAQSGMATELEKQNQGAQFRVLDPPNLPQKPYSPNRLKLDLIGLVAGLMVGIAVLAGGEIVDDRIYSKEELATIVSAPILSEIPPLTTAAEEGRQVRAEWLQRGTLSMMAVLTAAGFATTYLFG
jgi:polysaccharide chain length determinant protein (PEP-CTERM system associated)